jgi:hypothetical protein
MLFRNIWNYQRACNTILDCCDNLKSLLKKCWMRDFRLSPLCRWGRRSSGLMRSFRLLDIFILEDGNYALYRRVSNKLPFEFKWLLVNCWGFGGIFVKIRSNNKQRIKSRPPKICSFHWPVAAVKQLNSYWLCVLGCEQFVPNYDS